MGKPSNRPVKILIFIAVLWRSALIFSGFKTMTPDYGLEPQKRPEFMLPTIAIIFTLLLDVLSF